MSTTAAIITSVIKAVEPSHIKVETFFWSLIPRNIFLWVEFVVESDFWNLHFYVGRLHGVNHWCDDSCGNHVYPWITCRNVWRPCDILFSIPDWNNDLIYFLFFLLHHVQHPGAVFTKGLSQNLGLSIVCFYKRFKPKSWLRPFENTAPGVIILIRF